MDRDPSEGSSGVFHRNSKHEQEEEALISLEELEKRHISKVIKSAHFNKTRAAQILGIDRATLYRKAERYQIALGEKEELASTTLSEPGTREPAVH